MIVGVGVDIEDVPRFQRVIERVGARFLERVFTPSEIEYVEARAHRHRRYASRFAAKEAAMKALGTGWAQGVRWHDFEISREASGAPRLALTGAAARHAESLGCTRTHLSLSHTPASAVAQVILEG